MIGVTSEQKVQLAAFMLEGEAENWWSLQEEFLATWDGKDSLKLSMLNTFQSLSGTRKNWNF